LVGNYSNISPKAHTPATRLYANRPPFDQAVSAHFFGAMEIDGFIRQRRVQKTDRRMDSRLPQYQPGTNGPLIPGDPEREAEAIRSKEGIPLIQPVVDDLLDISRKTGIPFHAN